MYLRDLSHERTASHGIVNYALGLAIAVAAALADDERLVLLGNSEIADLLPDGNERVEVEASDPPPRGLSRLITDQVTGLRIASQRSLGLLHFPKGFIPLVNPTRTRIVATLHDDIPLRYWEGAWGSEQRSAQTAYFGWNVGHTVKRADATLTVSEFTRRQVQQRWPKADVTVTGQAVALPSTDFVPRAARRPAALLFGSPLPHKRSSAGIAHLLDWLDRHPDQGVDELHVLGSIDGDPPSDPRVRVLPGGRSNAEVADLVAHSRLLLFPSAYEGFGLPPLEAALAGTPVVFARIPAVQEVLGADAEGGYEHGDQASFDTAMGAALSLDDDQVRRRATELAQQHRWEAVAAATLAEYRRLTRA